MSQKIYQIDAFADALFSGNPAAVCPLENWLDADIMQKIAAENNLAETAFTVPVENGYEIRWFTPEVEVDLCGHATLASAYTLMNFEGFLGEKINFYSRNSGTLTVTKNGDFLTLDFPVDNLQKVEGLAIFEKCFAYQSIEAVSYTHLDVYKRQDLQSVETLKKDPKAVSYTHLDVYKRQ